MPDPRDYNALTTVMSAKATTGVGTSIDVADHRHLMIEIATASSANLTVKCQGAIGDTAPDFATAQSASNVWDYIAMVDLQNGQPVEGDTGFSVAGTDDVRLFEINTNGLNWLNFNVTARTAGSVTIKVKQFNP